MRRVECVLWKERWARCHLENVHPPDSKSNANALISLNLIPQNRRKIRRKKKIRFPQGYDVCWNFIFEWKGPTYLLPGIISINQCRWTGIRTGLLHWILCWLLQSLCQELYNGSSSYNHSIFFPLLAHPLFRLTIGELLSQVLHLINKNDLWLSIELFLLR